VSTPVAVLDAYGSWISSLARWSVFVTATHARPKTRTVAQAENVVVYDRVGVQRHRKVLRDWFYDVVRQADPTARWWSEMEFHESGVPHEHGLLETELSFTGRLYVRDVWRREHGDHEKGQGMRFDSIKESPVGVARYVAKYAGKAAAHEPCIYGFGLLSRPSFSQRLPG
jgi:hypothetical protein